MMGPPPPPPPTAAPYPPSWGGFAQPGAEMGGHRGLSGMVPYAAPPSPYRIHPSSHGPPSRRPVEEEAMSPTVSRTVSEDVMTGPPPMGSVPLPSGTQIVIPDVAGNLQKYVVNYAIWTMPESSAKEYVQHMLRMEPQAGGQMMGPGMVSIPSTAIQHRSALRSVSHQAPSHAPPPASFCRLNGRG
uniref:Uncharacterized protein n=1 Tax=Grammatophora oceanica TaxID=210454 RepID=A0A7S1VWG7_9STRA|mmetsp:Transcript_8680/g.12703  ORF Transcript_8680/g.12703 Transcript_8680/m.12703 type:complete len:186 (+) Transcript_8680:1-558(+)